MVIFTGQTALDLHRLGIAGERVDAHEARRALAPQGHERYELLNAWRRLAATSEVREGVFREGLRSGASVDVIHKPLLHGLVAKGADRYGSGAVSHVFGGRVPAGALMCISVGEGVSRVLTIYVTSPEFTLFILHRQLRRLAAGGASRLPWVVGTLSAGFELCGGYLRFPRSLLSAEPSMRAREGWEPPAKAVSEPVTSGARIAALTRQLESSTHGIEAFGTLLEHLLDRSASPMETAVALLLCLPRKLGGYGLPKPELNGYLTLTDRAKTLAGQQGMACDLLWRREGVLLEYDSDAHHVRDATSEMILKDKHRANAAGDVGVRSVSLTRDQLMSDEAFDAIATSIEDDLGLRRRPCTQEMLARRAELRDLVLRARENAP